MSAKNERLFTEVELELMTILWKMGEGSVADVIAGLPPERDLAYTSVSTVLRILEQKGALQARKEGRGHIYVPRVDKKAYEARAVNDVVEKVFEGEPVALMKQLLGNQKFSAAELAQIKKMIGEMS